MSWFREWLWGTDGSVDPDDVGDAPVRTDRGPDAGRRQAPPTRSTPSTSTRGGGADTADPYPGQGFDLPERGVDSVATLPLRGGQFLLDSVLAGIVAAAISFPAPWQLSLALWVLFVLPTVALLGQTPAMVLLGMRVARVDGAPRVGLAWAAARTVSLFFLVPAFLVDHDARGLHDRISRTIVLRTR